MDVVTFFKWDSKASKTTLMFPLVAIGITVAFFLLYIFDDSSVSQPVFDAVRPLVLSIIVSVLDVILILGMLFFQPTKKRIIKPKVDENEDSKTVVISAEDTDEKAEAGEEGDVEEDAAKKDLEEVKVTTSDEKEDEEILAKGLAAEMSEEPELEAEPENIQIEDIEEPKQTAMVKDILTFPESVGGGIFGDTYISVGNGTTLKLRQEVVEEIYLIG